MIACFLFLFVRLKEDDCRRHRTFPQADYFSSGCENSHRVLQVVPGEYCRLLLPPSRILVVVFVCDLVGTGKGQGLYGSSPDLARIATTLSVRRGRGSSFACQSRPSPGLAACLLQEPLPLIKHVVAVLLGPGVDEVGAHVGLVVIHLECKQDDDDFLLSEAER